MTQIDDFNPAGLPPFEKFYLNALLKFGSAFRSDKAILADFQQSAADICQIMDEQDLGVLSQEILVPRLQGIEHSSRNWSALMVLDHLAQVNRIITETIRSLRNNSQPFQVIRLEDFKPHPDVGAEAIDDFRDSAQRYWSFVTSHQPLRTSLTFAHPWFGRLDGHGWHCLAAAHQRIHRRQIFKILAMIGVA